MQGETALDRMWNTLDELTDALIDHTTEDIKETRAEAKATAKCIAEFYGGDVERIRLLEMGRRAIRERSRAETVRRTRGAVRESAV